MGLPAGAACNVDSTNSGEDIFCSRWSRKALRHGAGGDFIPGVRAVCDMFRTVEKMDERRAVATFVMGAILSVSTDQLDWRLFGKGGLLFTIGSERKIDERGQEEKFWA